MAKTFFKLPGYYEGIRARRIKQSGRLWLVRVVNDPDKRGEGTFKPYWFVLIKGFDPIRDKASGATSIGVWRFGYEDEAFHKFEELEPLYPPFVPSAAQLAARNRMKLGSIRPKTPLRAQTSLKIPARIPASTPFEGQGTMTTRGAG